MDNFDAIETHYQNEQGFARELRERFRGTIQERVQQSLAEIHALFGEDLPAEWIIEKLDLGGLSFWGGPPRSFFEGKTPEECFTYLEGIIWQYPEGVMAIEPAAVRGRVTPVYKVEGKHGQLWLVWMWKP